MEKASCTGVYMQNRLDCCLKLLGRSRRRRKGSKPVVEWSTPPENYFEKPCHGVYESCKERECVIKTAQKPTEKITDDPKPSKLKTNETPAVEPTGESFITAWKQLELQVKALLFMFHRMHYNNFSVYLRKTKIMATSQVRPGRLPKRETLKKNHWVDEDEESTHHLSHVM